MKRLFVVISLLCTNPAWGLTITQAGVTFSDDLGGFRLLSVTGRGSQSDPFVITEEVTGQGAAVLQIEGFNEDGVGGDGALKGAGLFIRKIVVNATEVTWTAFDMELREKLEQPSGYLDGLSFGQMVRETRVNGADLLPNVLVRDEPYDAMIFSGGYVPPADSVAITAIITDITPVSPFYLIQHLQVDVVALPAPSLALVP